MDITQEELHSYKIYDILKESLSIAKISPKTFYFITVTLIFPLSFAILAHSLFTHPILAHITSPSTSLSESRHEFTRLLIFEFSYRIFLFTFSLLSTAAIVFTVASLYTSKPVSFTSTLSAIPKVFKRLFITFIWVVALIVVYHLVIFSCMFLFILAYGIHSKVLEFLSLSIAVLMYTVVHVYITAIWHLASVVSVLEPVYGLAAMKKSYELLKGRTMMAIILVFVYFLICAVISMTFTVIVVHDDQNCGASIRTSVGALLVVVLVVVNFVGLLVQSVFYYVCKSYHHQGIDKSALYDQLGGYLGEYVPLKSDIQMENLDA